MGDRWRFVAVVVTLAVLVVGWRATLDAVPDEAPSVSIEGPESTIPAVSSVVVHVAGAVMQPGLVELPSGSRVADAILAAGGAMPDARLDLINLATPVAADQQIVVPRSDGSTSGAAVDGGRATGGPISLNRADVAELQQLPGVGPVLAQRIVDHRSEVGPFASVEDLLDVSGIGERTLATIRDLVAVP